MQSEGTTPTGATLKRTPIVPKTEADLEAERAEVLMCEAIRGERVTVEEFPSGSVEEEFIPIRSPTLDPERYADVDDALPAPDATVIHDDATGELTDDQDEEMDDDTMASGPSISRMRSVGSVTSGSGLSACDVSRNLNRRSAGSLERVAELRELIHEGIAEKPQWGAAFAIWKEHVSNGRYDAPTNASQS
jgi:hypothetical protein